MNGGLGAVRNLAEWGKLMDDDYDRLEREMAEQNERIAKLIATAEVVRPIKSSVPPEVLAADTKAGAHLRPGIVALRLCRTLSAGARLGPVSEVMSDVPFLCLIARERT